MLSSTEGLVTLGMPKGPSLESKWVKQAQFCGLQRAKLHQAVRLGRDGDS